MREKKVIGKRDKVSFPEFSLKDIDCKIDTGAATSAIHCHQIKLTKRKGVLGVSFRLLDPEHPAYNDVTYWTSDFREKIIKSSFGEVEKRYMIRTKVVLFGKRYMTSFTLTDRKAMRFPVLIGRRLLKNRFLVDVSSEYLSFKARKS
ncbi:MAG: hypothetical protein EAZ55_08700 [Cytophagales bacterium]|nr:MAG: hypothetical protein EAZ55_08700 [Cytophagales bacterium]